MKIILYSLIISSLVMKVITSNCSINLNTTQAVGAQECDLESYIGDYHVRFIDIPEELLIHSQKERINKSLVQEVLQTLDNIELADTSSIFVIKANIYDLETIKALDEIIVDIKREFKNFTVMSKEEVTQSLMNGSNESSFDHLGKVVIILSAAFDECKECIYIKASLLLDEDATKTPKNLLGNPDVLSIKDLSKKERSCQYMNHTMQGDFQFIYSQKDNAGIDISKLKQAYSCGVTVIFSAKQLTENAHILTDGFLFLTLITAVEDINTTGCFYLSSLKTADRYGKLQLNYNKRCMLNGTLPVLCRNISSGDLFKGKSLPTMGDLPVEVACKGGNISFPTTTLEVEKVTSIMQSKNLNAIWISLKTVDSQDGKLTWAHHKMIQSVSSGTNLNEMIGLAVFFLIIIVLGAVIIFVLGNQAKVKNFKYQQSRVENSIRKEKNGTKKNYQYLQMQTSKEEKAI